MDAALTKQRYQQTGGPVHNDVLLVEAHGWPLTADAWEAQMFFLASNGYRCIAHDRRGHGRSSQPWNGNDMDTFADDLSALIEALDLNAVMLYAGFAWGAGAFLALPPGAQGWMLAAFAIGGAAAIGMLLRARNATLYFLAPNVVLAAGSALLGPAGWDAAAGLLALGLALAGAAELLERLAARRIQAPRLASLTLS